MRATSLLQTVTPAERAAIEETAYSIATKVVDCILDEAAGCASLPPALTAEVPLSESDGRAFGHQNRQREPNGVVRPRKASA